MKSLVQNKATHREACRLDVTLQSVWLEAVTDGIEAEGVWVRVKAASWISRSTVRVRTFWTGPFLEEQSDPEEPAAHRLPAPRMLRARGPPSGSGSQVRDKMSESGDKEVKQTRQLSNAARPAQWWQPVAEEVRSCAALGCGPT